MTGHSPEPNRKYIGMCLRMTASLTDYWWLEQLHSLVLPSVRPPSVHSILFPGICQHFHDGLSNTWAREWSKVSTSAPQQYYTGNGRIYLLIRWIAELGRWLIEVLLCPLHQCEPSPPLWELLTSHRELEVCMKAGLHPEVQKDRDTLHIEKQGLHGLWTWV